MKKVDLKEGWTLEAQRVRRGYEVRWVGRARHTGGVSLRIGGRSTLKEIITAAVNARHEEPPEALAVGVTFVHFERLRAGEQVGVPTKERVRLGQVLRVTCDELVIWAHVLEMVGLGRDTDIVTLREVEH